MVNSYANSLLEAVTGGIGLGLWLCALLVLFGGRG